MNIFFGYLFVPADRHDVLLVPRFTERCWTMVWLDCVEDRLVGSQASPAMRDVP